MKVVKSILPIKELFIILLITFSGNCFSQTEVNSIDFYPNGKYYCGEFKFLPFPRYLSKEDSSTRRSQNDEADTLLKKLFKKRNPFKDTILIFTFARTNSIENFVIIVQKNNNFLSVLTQGIITTSKMNKRTGVRKVIFKEKKLDKFNLGSYVFINRILSNKCSADNVLIYDSEHEDIGALKYFVFENREVIYNSSWYAFMF